MPRLFTTVAAVLAFAAALSPQTAVNAQSSSTSHPAFAQVWIGTTTCNGTPNAATNVTADGKTCTAVSPGGVIVSCNPDESWNAYIYLDSECVGGDVAAPSGTSNTVCTPINIYGRSGSAIVDCTDKGLYPQQSSSTNGTSTQTTQAPSSGSGVSLTVGALVAAVPLLAAALL